MTWLALATMGVVMFATGLSLRGRDFARLRNMPRRVLSLLSLQVLVLPVAAFVVSQLLPDGERPAIWIAALAPATAASHVLVGLAGGHIGLARTITAWSSVLFIPVALVTGLDRVLPGLWSSLLFLYALPLMLGLVISAQAQLLAVPLERRLSLLGSLLTGVIVLITFVAAGADLLDLPLIGTALLMAITGVLGGWAVQNLAGRDAGVTGALILPLQNVAVAMGLCWAAGAEPYTLFAAYYAVAMYLAGFAFIAIRLRLR